MHLINMWILNFFKNIFYKDKEVNWKDGLVPSPVDYRDIPLGSVVDELKEIPIEYHIPYFLNVKNQGNTPHCVGYSCSTIKEEKERKEQNYVIFDGDWIYRECKKIDGIPSFPGTYFRSGLSVLKNKGAKPENEEEYEKYRIGGYIKVDNNLEAIKRAMYEFGCVLIGVRGSNPGWRNYFVRPPYNNEVQWGHAIVGIGYNKDGIVFQNSWGKQFGDNGYGLLRKDYEPYIMECWAVIIDLPNNWKELIAKDEKPKYRFNNNLYYGLVNDEVSKLQDCLKYLGCMSKEVESSGYFGTITKEASKIFQTRYNIYPVSGFVGPLTRKKLNELFA